MQSIKNITNSFLANTLDMNGENIPSHVWDIYTTLVGVGGIGIPDPEITSIRNFVILMVRSIRYAQHSITPSNYSIRGVLDDDAPHIELPYYIKAAYLSWETSSLTIFVTY